MDEKDPLRIENQLCFPLYAASKAVIRRYEPYLSEIGLTYTQYIAMMALWEYGETDVKDLGERLRLDSGTLTPLLKRLEGKGLVTRGRAADDERRLSVRLTQEGEALKGRALGVPEKMGRCVTLTDEETARLYALLYRLLEDMEKQREE